MAGGEDRLKQWLGTTESQVDQASSQPPKALAAMLDRDDPEPQTGSPVPPCWHWLYFLSLPKRLKLVRMDTRSEDGASAHLCAEHPDGALAMDATAGSG